jgi:hypothetical protein
MSQSHTDRDVAESGRPAPPAAELLTLRSDVLEVALLPRKGADIYSIVDRLSGIDVLFKSPWGWRDPTSLPSGTDSKVDWLARYPGGWQQLVPNAGEARVVDSVTRGFHGEAAVVPWMLEHSSDSVARLTVDLTTAPLRLDRQVALEGPLLSVQDTIRNLSPDPVEFMWVQHPVFGAPFVDEHARIHTGACVFISDAEAPGTLLPANIVSAFPHASDLDGGSLDLRVVPGQDTAREVFGALADFADGWFSITSPTAGFAIRVDWDPGTYPYAWFWQECHATKGFPWFQRAYAIAVEPANVLPGSGRVGRWQRGHSEPLGGGESRVAQLRFSRTPLP